MNTAKRLLSLVLVLAMLGSVTVFVATPADAIYSFTIVRQNISQWRGVYYGAGDLYDTGCGIFALVNAVGCLTGKSMNVKTVAQYAYDIGAYNNGGANGTARLVLYPKVEGKFGSTYGFTLDCNNGQGWWAGSSSSVLINHLKSGGVAVGHVPGHFIAIVDYNTSNGKFHVYDSYPTTARGTGTGDCWVTPSQLATNKLKLDWFCLLSKADDGTIKENPTITAGSFVLTHGMSLTPQWAALDNAVNYTYRVRRYDSEITNNGTVPYTTVIPDTTSTATSFTIPGQSTGKYLEITVTANGNKNSTTSTKTVLIGANVSRPSDVESIPVSSVNGGTGTSATTVWNVKKGANFTALWWQAVLCAPQSDGSYKVTATYAAGAEKNVPITGGNIVIASHSGMADYSKVYALKVGNKITLHGLYLDDSSMRGAGYILVNDGKVEKPTLSVPSLTLNHGETMDITWNACTGATTYGAIVKNGSTTVLYNENVTGNKITIPAQSTGTSLTVTITAWNSLETSEPATVTITLVQLVPNDITVKDSSISKGGSNADMFVGYGASTTVENALSKFAEDSKYLQIRNHGGAAVSANAIIGTGYTVNIIDGATVKKSYKLVVVGDITGDGVITSSDVLGAASHLTSGAPLIDEYLEAADYDENGSVTSSDYLTLAKSVSSL